MPRANPDFEDAYQRVAYWWLEIDADGQVQREIGFDDEDCPVAIAPFRENFGVFTDCDGHPEPLGQQQDALQFERAWSEIASSFMQDAAQHGTAVDRSQRSLS